MAFFAVQFFYAQNDYSKVLDLLIANDRDGARKLFDKQFVKTKTSNIDLLFLDALIDEEKGRLYYDESFLKAIETLPNAKYYIPPFINDSYVLDDIKEGSFNDLTYKKIDFLSNSSVFKDVPVVKYRKAVYESLRHKNEQSIQSYLAIDAIRKWQFCGVFENLNSSGLEIEYEPERYPKSDKTFDANSNGVVGWYVPKKESFDPYYFFGNESEYGSGVIYAQTFIEAPKTADYVLKFGANKGIKVFLNDKEIFFNQDIHKTNLDAYAITLPLSKGFNRLLIKIGLGSADDYFSASVRNLDSSVPNDLKFHNSYMPYESNKNDLLESKELTLDFEEYFRKLLEKDPNNVLYKFYLFKAYECNNKSQKAYEVIDGLDKQFPKSSFINALFIRYFLTLQDEGQKIIEIVKNIETNDPDYHLNFSFKLTDQEWLKSASIQELEKYKEKSSKLLEKFQSKMYDFMIISRKGDVDGMMNKFDEILKDSYNNEKFKILIASLYTSLKNDKEKALKIVEEFYAEKDNYEAYLMLINFYNSLNQKDKVKALIEAKIAKNYASNEFRNSMVEILKKENQYEKALALIDENLAYFPYSFTNFEKKADVYAFMKNEKEAEKYIRKALIHNSGNSSIRKQLYDITKTPDEIEEVATKDIYTVIKKRRGTKLQSNYGVVTLLDEYVVNILPEGGRKSKITFLYEITAESGIEEFKEYNINSNATVLKSEIVRQDGSLTPAEDDSSGTLVFPDLKVGDVVHVSYQLYENESGRFYKDFNLSCTFNSIYPVVEAIFGLIAPESVAYNKVFSNGEIPATLKKMKGKVATVWKTANTLGVPQQENYAPVYSDIVNTITVGTIKSWSEIANWYADLVKKQLKNEIIVQKAFNEIFPSGYKQLSEEERAKKIYDYIETNIKYSYLDFRQSGYVPQKPSKTITTKLGDCKDVSTLFVVLSEMAGLKSNLVLVLTNDNAKTSLVLPSSNFNHCIARTFLDGKEVYLELTDKYLPFKALPTSLYGAKALNISFDKLKNENVGLVDIKFDNALKNITKTYTVVNVDDKIKTFVNKHVIQGATKSYYNELFSTSKTDDVRKKEVEENFNTRIKKNVILDTIKLVQNELFDKDITFETKFSISENLQKVGNLKITQIPFLDNVYTRDIIASENRNFDINYHNYESMNEYESEIIMNLPNGKTFSELPSNKTISYKEHKYSLVFELVDSKSLKIKRNVMVPWEVITKVEYPQYKKFVEEVLEAEEQIIGFK